MHLESYPISDTSAIDSQLSNSTRLGMRICSLGRAARSKAGIKVRQPLKEVYVVLRPSDRDLLDMVIPQIREELNVKKVSVVEDEREFTTVDVKPNLALLGPKYGPMLRELQDALSEANPQELYSQVHGHPSMSKGSKSPGPNPSTHPNNELDKPRGEQPVVQVGKFELRSEDLQFIANDRDGLSVSNDGGYTVAIATEVSPELALEGLAREMVHLIQNMRRSAGFDISDQITTYYEGSEQLEAVIPIHQDYLLQETLSMELVNGQAPKGSFVENHKINNFEITLSVRRMD